MIHASFVISSHVSIIILHHFYAFCRTNLLTRCLVPVCCFSISENLLLKIFSELDENLRGILFDGRHLETKGRPGGPPTGQGCPPAAAPGPPAGGTRPCPWGTPSAPSDAYKITLNLKTSKRPLFSREVTPTRRHLKP